MPFSAPQSDPGSRLGLWFRPVPVACFACAVDLCWFLQALSAAPSRTGSNVAMASLVVWMVLHLPAALLAGGLLALAGALNGPVQALPPWSQALLGVLGLSQTFALALGLSVWRRRTR